MTDETRHTERECHEKFAKDCFNLTWTYLEKSTLTAEEADAMIHAAHASRHHWQQVGRPVNLARGEWQIARVYAVLERSEPALHHARRCLAICEADALGAFDLAFAYEALARATAIAGDGPAARRYIELAKDTAEKITEADTRKYVFDELKTIPALPGD